MRLLSLLLAFFLYLPFPVYSQEISVDRPIRILLLHSYSETQSWTYDENQGFLDVLNNTSYNFDISVEYMDTKRHYSDHYYKSFEKFFLFKHAQNDLDMIAVTDDNALSFILALKNTYFIDTPLFFCGANALHPYDFSSYNNISGIREKISLEDTLDTIISLQPNTEKVYFLFDASRTARITIDDIHERMKSDSHTLEYEVIAAKSLDKLAAFTQSISEENSALIYGFFMIDEQGIAFDPNYSAEVITATTNHPIYGLWTFSLNSGVIGGKLVSGYSQGQKMGELLINRLDGKIDNFFLDSALGNNYIFDYTALKAHNLMPGRLPKGSLFINKPESFYEQHKSVLLTSFGLLLLLLIYIIALSLQVKKKTVAIETTTSQLMEFKRQASLTHLVSGVAHDINTPLGNIVTMLDFTKRLSSHQNGYDKKLAQALGHIEVSVDQLSSLMRKFKRISTEFDRRNVGTQLLADAIKEIVLLISSTNEHSFDFILHCDKNITFPINKGHLYDIFEPLIVNSLEHGFINMKQGQIMISVEKNDSETIIVYEDNGVGLKNACDDKIFEPFYSTAKNLNHSGLGLFGSKTTISAYCGTIVCHTKKEKGVKFLITLPLECSLYK